MMIDFHAHILPDMDDGSASVAESVAMLEMVAQQGVCGVVATPHFYAHRDTPEHFLKKRREIYQKLCTATEGNSSLPRLLLGAEVTFFRGISESDSLSQLTIAGGNHILIEMPCGPWTDAMYRELAGIYENQGITPILAHLDRYIGSVRTFGIPERLASMPVLVQANAAFFLKRTTRPMALYLLSRDRIHLLGSDCHNLTSRPPNLGDAVKVIEKRFGQQRISQMQAYQKRILAKEW